MPFECINCKHVKPSATELNIIAFVPSDFRNDTLPPGIVIVPDGVVVVVVCAGWTGVCVVKPKLGSKIFTKIFWPFEFS